MTFSEKLDLLMTLTGISNSALGRSLSYDASYISRVRAGKRGLPRSQPFLEPVSDLLAKAIVPSLQQTAAANLITPGEIWPDDPAEGAALIHRWLQSATETAPIGQFFQSVTGPRPDLPHPPLDPAPEIPDPAFLYGNQGKRTGVLRMLTDLCATGQPQTLHLFSDENMDWLYENAAFSRQWLGLLARFLTQGGTITIIHTVDRDLSEMLEALQRWIPLYLTGGIRPYYCPRLRDGILRRSLFVAPGLASLTAGSIQSNTEGMLNLYTTDPKAVAACEQEFLNYLALCRPLMDIYRPDRSRELAQRLTDMAASDQPLLWAGQIPLPLVGPLPSAAEPLRQVLLSRLNAGKPLVELLCLPSPRRIRPLPLPLADFWEEGSLSYDLPGLRDQVAAALERMTVYPNSLVLLTDRLPDALCLLAGEQEVLVFSSAPSATVFALTEPRMTTALWDYLRRAQGRTDRQTALRKLKSRLVSLNKSLAKSSRQGGP